VLEKNPEKVKLVFKNYPLHIHPYARSAALAALAAYEQGKWWEYHQKLFANQAAFNDAKFLELAAQLGLDVEKFKRDMASPALQKIVDRDINEGRRFGVRGVPTVYVNGRPLEERSPRGIQLMIDSELKQEDGK
jgi:protein-disulfide isomerase